MSTGQQKRGQKRRKQSAREEMSSMQREKLGAIRQHPMSSAFIVFGIGLGVGMALGCALSGPTTPPTFGERAELAAEKLGRQVLDAFAQVLPHSLARHVS